MSWPNILACLPASMAARVGSSRRRCGECHQDVWASPASLEHAGPGAILVCLHCLPFADLRTELAQPTPAQLAEIRQAIASRN